MSQRTVREPTDEELEELKRDGAPGSRPGSGPRSHRSLEQSRILCFADREDSRRDRPNGLQMVRPVRRGRAFGTL